MTKLFYFLIILLVIVGIAGFLDSQTHFLTKEIGDIGRGIPGFLTPQRPTNGSAGTNPKEEPQSKPASGTQTFSPNSGQ